MGTIKESLTFDDVLLIPQYSNVLPSETNISIKLSPILRKKKRENLWTKTCIIMEYFFEKNLIMNDLIKISAVIIYDLKDILKWRNEK